MKCYVRGSSLGQSGAYAISGRNLRLRGGGGLGRGGGEERDDKESVVVEEERGRKGWKRRKKGRRRRSRTSYARSVQGTIARVQADSSIRYVSTEHGVASA
eukprot:133869-Rhodomonas_salina.2